MKIQVTQKHINEGKRGECFNCPIALALLEATGQQWDVSFHMACSWHYNLNLPEIAQEFIGRFDYEKTVKPFEFELPI